jgi:hypothetical protein
VQQPQRRETCGPERDKVRVRALRPNVEDTRQGKPSRSGSAKRQAHALRATAEFRRRLPGAVIEESPYQTDTLPVEFYSDRRCSGRPRDEGHCRAIFAKRLGTRRPRSVRANGVPAFTSDVRGCLRLKRGTPHTNERQNRTRTGFRSFEEPLVLLALSIGTMESAGFAGGVRNTSRTV